MRKDTPTSSDSILELVRVQPGATRKEIVEAVCAGSDDDPDKVQARVYSTIYNLTQQGKLVEQNGKLSVAAHHEKPTPNLSDLHRKREARTVLVQQSPMEVNSVKKIALVFNGRGQFALPMFGNLRICTGPDIPLWSPDQEVYRGVTRIILTLENGKQEEITTVESYPITVAQQ